MPYPTGEVHGPARLVKFTSRTERVQIFLKRPTVVNLDLSTDRMEIKSFSLKTMPMPVLLLPHDTLSTIQGVVRLRLDSHSTNVWKEQMSCKKHSH